MPKTPFSSRRAGRCYFRRRIRFLDSRDLSGIVPLAGCDGQEAHERSAMFASHQFMAGNRARPSEESQADHGHGAWRLSAPER